MPLSRRRKILIAVLGVGVCGIAAYVALFFWVSAQVVAARQQVTMKEIQKLASWEREFAHISTAKEAERASKTFEYARDYYVVGPHFPCDPETDEKLEAQRRRTIDSILSAIEEFKRQEAAKAPASSSGSTD